MRSRTTIWAGCGCLSQFKEFLLCSLTTPEIPNHWLENVGFFTSKSEFPFPWKCLCLIWNNVSLIPYLVHIRWAFTAYHVFNLICQFHNICHIFLEESRFLNTNLSKTYIMWGHSQAHSFSPRLCCSLCISLWMCTFCSLSLFDVHVPSFWILLHEIEHFCPWFTMKCCACAGLNAVSFNLTELW